MVLGVKLAVCYTRVRMCYRRPNSLNFSLKRLFWLYGTEFRIIAAGVGWKGASGAKVTFVSQEMKYIQWLR